MFFNSITFKDSATPFAEALVELHHEIMFYLIVIVSVVIFILVNAVNITRVRESFFYSQIFSLVAFLKALMLNFIFLPLFNRFLYSSYYLMFSNRIYDNLINFIYLAVSKAGSYLNYLLNFIILSKSYFLKFLAFFSVLEMFTSKFLGDSKKVKFRDRLPNSFISNNFFYKTRNSSSYLSYISNIVSYISILSIFNDLDYKNFYSNKNIFFSYFYDISAVRGVLNLSRSVVNNLDLNSLEALHSSNALPNFENMNSHFFNFFSSFLKFKFSAGNSMRFYESRLSNIFASDSRSLYAFLNAQTYTVHNTKLEII